MFSVIILPDSSTISGAKLFNLFTCQIKVDNLADNLDMKFR
jgi:hypothetical protein